jgi:hypothetical protein
MNYLAKRVVFIIVSVAILVVATSFFNPSNNNKGKHRISVFFEDYVRDKYLKLDSGVYKNGFGQSYTVSRLRYYIGNIHLIKKDGTEGYSSSEYYLIDDAGPGSNIIELNVDQDDYSSINFIIGVDSIHNCSGIQTGVLDPTLGMFWAWNAGYVFFKMDGQSPASKSTGNMLEFHIGGYKYPNNCIREINLNLAPKGIKKLSNDYSVITIKADISKVFDAVNKIDFSMVSTVSDFHNATTIADNYKTMFSVIQ